MFKMNKIKRCKLYPIMSCLIIFINVCLNSLFISKEGYSNEYYSAAVKSMLLSFKNFFFVSFDPVGFLTVDKPPLGLWLQAICAKIFGLNTFAILLPSIISSAIVCFLIYKIMAKNFGPTYGLIAEFVFCFTPIIIAVSRTNNLDMSLMLFMVLSIFFTIEACQQKKFYLFLLAMIMLGFAFNIKMFQAYMILPAIFIYFIISNQISLRTFYKCVVSFLLLLIISFSWTIITELTPKDDRPFIGGSGSDNSVLTLMFGHNGFERLTGRKMAEFEPDYKMDKDLPNENFRPDKFNFYGEHSPFQNANFNKTQSKNFDEIGQPGLLRLFDLTDASMYEQISWLLLPALFCIAIIFFYKKFPILNRRQIEVIILWSLSLLPMIIFFDIAEFFHRYYLAMMAPSISCLFSALCYVIKNSSSKKFKIVSYVLYAVTFLIQLCFVLRAKIYFLAIAMLIEIFFAIVVMLKKKILVLFLLSIFTAPIVYSFYPVFTNLNSVMPAVDVASKKTFVGGDKQKTVDEKLLDFLIENKSDEKYFLVVSNCNEASSIILNTDFSVISINGFEGTDNTITLDKLKTLIKAKQIKYYMLGDSHLGQNEINNWVKENAKLVYSDKNSGFSPGGNGHILYDLSSCSLSS